MSKNSDMKYDKLNKSSTKETDNILELKQALYDNLIRCHGLGRNQCQIVIECVEKTFAQYITKNNSDDV